MKTVMIAQNKSQVQAQAIAYMISISMKDGNPREEMIHTRLMMVRQPMPTTIL